MHLRIVFHGIVLIKNKNAEHFSILSKELKTMSAKYKFPADIIVNVCVCASDDIYDSLKLLKVFFGDKYKSHLICFYNAWKEIHNDETIESLFKICDLLQKDQAVKLIKNEIKNKNIHSNNEYAFRWTCTNGHYKLVKCLVGYSNSISSPIDIHVNNEYVFRWACENNRYKYDKIFT